jgi:site-specific recombinase XerD
VPSDSLAASAAAFLSHLAARAYSAPSIDAHRWALKGFVEWADSQELATPASFTRARIEAFQLYLHQYRSPRGGKPLGTNTQLARLGCVRRFFAWLCRSGTIPANPTADLDLPRKQARQLPKALSAQEINLLLAIHTLKSASYNEADVHIELLSAIKNIHWIQTVNARSFPDINDTLVGNCCNRRGKSWQPLGPSAFPALRRPHRVRIALGRADPTND